MGIAVSKSVMALRPWADDEKTRRASYKEAVGLFRAGARVWTLWGKTIAKDLNCTVVALNAGSKYGAKYFPHERIIRFNTLEQVNNWTPRVIRLYMQHELSHVLGWRYDEVKCTHKHECHISTPQGHYYGSLSPHEVDVTVAKYGHGRCVHPLVQERLWEIGRLRKQKQRQLNWRADLIGDRRDIYKALKAERTGKRRKDVLNDLNRQVAILNRTIAARDKVIKSINDNLGAPSDPLLLKLTSVYGNNHRKVLHDQVGGF